MRVGLKSSKSDLRIMNGLCVKVLHISLMLQEVGDFGAKKSIGLMKMLARPKSLQVNT